MNYFKCKTHTHKSEDISISSKKAKVMIHNRVSCPLLGTSWTASLNKCVQKKHLCLDELLLRRSGGARKEVLENSPLNWKDDFHTDLDASSCSPSSYFSEFLEEICSNCGFKE